MIYRNKTYKQWGLFWPHKKDKERWLQKEGQDVKVTYYSGSQHKLHIQPSVEIFKIQMNGLQYAKMLK